MKYDFSTKQLHLLMLPYVLFQDSAKRVSAKRDSANWVLASRVSANPVSANPDWTTVTSSRSEFLSAANGCDWLTEISDVRRCRSMSPDTAWTGRAMWRKASGGGLATRAWYGCASWHRWLIVLLCSAQTAADWVNSVELQPADCYSSQLSKKQN